MGAQTAEQTAALIREPSEISGEWLARVLGLDAVTLTSVERIGTGQMSQSHRVAFSTGAGIGSVVVKQASDDETSRGTGVRMGAYYREVAFYQHLADRIEGPVPHCHLAVYDEVEGWFTLVLEDMAYAVQGDQITGCSVEQARVALRELAAVHAPVFNDLGTSTQDWLNLPNPLTGDLLAMLLPGFLERYGDRVAPEHAEVCRRFVASADAWYADRRPPLGLVHGDFRLDNLLFTDQGCTVVDWQTVTWGPAMLDLAYFLGGGLTSEDRRTHERELVEGYHRELVARGVQNFSLEECWEEYRRQVFLGLVMVIAPAMVVVQTERGDEMFMVLLERFCQQIVDLESLELLPDPGQKPAALVPAAEDEGLHQPGPEPLWNESYYFDAVSDDGTLGLYVRLGRLPNRDECVYTAAVVGPGRTPVMVVDYAAPLPASDDLLQRVETERINATQECLEPLVRYQVLLTGLGEAHADQAAPLRGETGDDITVELDLVWETDATPYQWRASTRYEIPCRVTGMVRLGDEELAFTGPGQRDHSYGARDWWANDWMWSAFHLEDGTRTHAVTAPDLPGFAVGYIQRDGLVTEVASGTSNAEDGVDGLPVQASIQVEPEGSLTVEPVAFGPLLLVAPDGRVAHFQRAMAEVRTPDGRAGVGWIEWNRNR